MVDASIGHLITESGAEAEQMTLDEGAQLDVAANAAAMKALQYHRRCKESFPQVYATRLISSGEVIDGRALEVRIVSIEELKTDSFLISKQQLIGRIAFKEMTAGQPVNIDCLEPAESYYQRLLEKAEGALGSNSIEVARLLKLMAESYWSSPRIDADFDFDNYARAEELERRALAIHEEQCGNNSVEVAEDCKRIAALCMRQEKFFEWKKFLERAMEIYAITNEDPSRVLIHLAHYYENEDDQPNSEKFLLKYVAARERQLCRSIIDLRTGLYTIAGFYCREKKFADAELVYRRLVAMDERNFGKDNVEVAESLRCYASFLVDRGRIEESDRLLSRAEQIGRHVDNTEK